MAQNASTPRARRARRSTEEVIDRLMDAAVEEFEEKGYSGATTAAIARRAEVAEALLFNHFGSKAQLFKDTIFKPLSRLFDTFLEEHPSLPDDPEQQRGHALEYIGEVQKLIATHPRMFLSLIFAQSYKSGEIDGLADVQGLHDYFAHSAGQALRNMKGEPAVDPELMARISFAAIMSSIVFRDWLFPAGRWEDRQIEEAISRFVMEGLGANNPAR